MRGTISLDLLLSVVVMLVISSAIVGMAFLQLENAAIANAQYKAEALAMGAGSAINHFQAMRADGGDLYLSLGDVSKRSARIGQAGWPDAFSLDLLACTMQVNGSVFWLNFTVHRVENNFDEYVNATYPLVTVSGNETAQPCNSTLIVSAAGVVSYRK
jgi:hypothetical protein